MRHVKAALRALVLVGLTAMLVTAADPEPAPSPTGRITLNFPSIPFGTFLKVLARAGDMKVIAGPKVAGKVVSVYLKDVTPRQALEAVCDAHDLFVDRTNPDGIIIIRERDVRFIALEHLDAKAVQQLLPAVVGEGGKMSFDEVNNVIAVQGGRRGLNRVEEMVRQMDRTPKQVLIRAALVELGEDAARQMGIRWEPAGFLRGAARQSRFPLKSPFIVDEAVSADAFTYGLVNFQDFLVDLKFLERDGKANILASPRIAALHGKEAEIKIITNTVIATKLTRESEDLNLVTEEPIYAEVGVTLKTTPRVHPDGKITLVVEPTVSTATRAAFFDEAVDTFERSARTTVMVDNDATIVIGGLLRTDHTTTVRGLPFLGRVPLVGYLFAQRDRVDKKTDLLIFLNPRIQSGKEAGAAAARDKARVKDALGDGLDGK